MASLDPALLAILVCPITRGPLRCMACQLGAGGATMVFADFMFKTGLIKVKPASWKEFFFPVVHNLPGT